MTARRPRARARRALAILLALLGGGSAPACVGGSETGNPVASELALSVHSTDPHVASVRGPATGTRVDSAWVSFGEIEFEPASACDLDLDAELVTPGRALDLVDARNAPSELGLPDDGYCRVEFELAPRARPLPPGAPAALEGRTIVIQGLTAAGAPFEIVSELDLGYEVRAPGGAFTIGGSGDGVARFVLSFDAAAWLTGLDLDAALASPDGVIRVTDEQNGDLLDRFEENLEGSADLVHDRNGNALRDEGETLD